MRAFILAVTGLAFAVAACSSYGTSVVDSEKPSTAQATIAISPASSNLQVGGTVQLAATTRDASGAVLTGRAIAWSSANAGISSVNSNGLVTAVSAGSTQITASSEGISSSAAITISAPAPVPVASVSVTPASSTVQVGGTVQLSAVALDGNSNPLAGRVVTWSSSAAGIASVNPTTGLVTAVGAGSATITATSETKTGTATITVNAPPPPPPPGATPLWRGNEPSGMTPVSDRQFNSLAEGSWWTMRAPGATIVSDATAPQSPSNVVQFNFAAGDVGGVSPEFTELSHTGYRILYICYWVKHSANWQGHLTGINKHGYVWHNTTNPYFFYSSEGAGSDPLHLRIALQSVAVQPNADGWYPQNVDATKTFTRGSWDLVEMVITGNTANTTNGSMDFYLNGTLVSRYTGIRFHATAETRWDFTRIYPVWGGAGDMVARNMGLSFDQFYISGKN